MTSNESADTSSKQTAPSPGDFAEAPPPARLCGISLKVFQYIAASVSAVITLPYPLWFVFFGRINYEVLVPTIIVAVLAVFAAICLVVGAMNRSKQAVWVYIISTVIEGMIVIAIFILVMCLYADKNIREKSSLNGEAPIGFVVAFAIYNVIWVALHIFYIWLACRFHSYMKTVSMYL